MKNKFFMCCVLSFLISSVSYAQALAEPIIKCELQEVVTSDTGIPQISVLTSDTKPLSGFWLTASATQKGYFLVTGGIQNGVASGILRFKDLVGNHSLVQSMTFSPSSHLQIELSAAKSTNGFGGTSIRLSCDISAY